MKNVTLGNLYRDHVTGITGAAVAEMESLNEEVTQVKIERVKDDGSLTGDWLSSARLSPA